MPPKPRSLAERLWPKIDRRGPDECWPWLASFTKGYGQIGSGGRGGHTVHAHRVAYELLVGPVPSGLHLDHLCRNRWCCNPAHCEPVTIGENLRRGIGPSGVNSRKTHCLRGHPFDEQNTRFDRRGNRRCRECARFAQSGFPTRQRRYGPKHHKLANVLTTDTLNG